MQEEKEKDIAYWWRLYEMDFFRLLKFIVGRDKFIFTSNFILENFKSAFFTIKFF